MSRGLRATLRISLLTGSLAAAACSTVSTSGTDSPPPGETSRKLERSPLIHSSSCSWTPVRAQHLDAPFATTDPSVIDELRAGFDEMMEGSHTEVDWQIVAVVTHDIVEPNKCEVGVVDNAIAVEIYSTENDLVGPDVKNIVLVRFTPDEPGALDGLDDAIIINGERIEYEAG